MINRNKKGFSLAELLLCAAIIGIISALGVNIAKKSTDNAYRTYFKSGYQTLYDSLADIQFRQGENVDNMTANRMAQELRELFGTNNNGNPLNVQSTAITRNGIRYRVELTNNNGGFIISMRIPQPKTRRNPDGITPVADQLCFLYNRYGNGFLIPLDNNILTNNRNNAATYNILRFYVDDSRVGRIRYNGQAGNDVSTEAISVLSYRDAACATNGHLVISVPSQYVKGITQNGNIVADAWEAPQSSWTFNGGTAYDICPGAGNGDNHGVIRQYTGR